MHPKLIVYTELRDICNTILGICAEIMEIKDIKADIWLSDIETFAGMDDAKTEAIMLRIQELYHISDDNMMMYLDSYTPLIQMAVFIYLRDEKVVADG